MASVTFKNLTPTQARVLADWYEGQGEQDAGIWFEFNGEGEGAPLVEFNTPYETSEDGSVTVTCN